MYNITRQVCEKGKKKSFLNDLCLLNNLPDIQQILILKDLQ